MSKRTQQDYEELLYEILEDKPYITIQELLDFLEKRGNSWNDQQIVRNIVSNREHVNSLFSQGILHYDETTGRITKNK
jgi:hypothetical protein